MGTVMEKEKKIKLNIVFVCTGNTCRSPMAEYMFKAYLKEKKRYGDFTVTSAGLYAKRGDKLSEAAHETLDEFGIKHDKERKARPFTLQMADDSDAVFAMTENHARLCGDVENVYSFDSVTGRAVDDPYGGDAESYRKTAKQIYAAFDAILEICDGLLEKKRESAAK